MTEPSRDSAARIEDAIEEEQAAERSESRDAMAREAQLTDKLADAIAKRADPKPNP